MLGSRDDRLLGLWAESGWRSQVRIVSNIKAYWYPQVFTLFALLIPLGFLTSSMLWLLHVRLPLAFICLKALSYL